VVNLPDIGTEDKTREELQQMLSILVQSKDLQSDVSIKLEARGTVVSFQEVLLFSSGSATVSEEGRAVISKVAEIIETVDNYISVEGSTDNVPMSNGQFSSNWELASQRAINVTKLLIEDGVDSSRISATSYGEYRPVAPNDTNENKAQNRRVDIVFIDPSLNEYQAGNGREIKTN
jgi:chemotaxis protein MotB